MSAQDVSNTSSTEPEGGYPPQLHAGAVGYGPEYGKGVPASTKISGFKEEVIGKVKHNPDLIQHGHDMRTGDLQRKEREEQDRALMPQEDAQPAGDAPATGITGSAPNAKQDQFDQERSGAIDADQDAVPARDQHARENVRI